ncbi:MAG: Type secretion system protein, partial [Frankiales bacterium]|nr:Type secretion system protein [Frankiales bacterium]
MTAAGVEAVELEVRELVRRRGIDPFHDRDAVHRLVDEVVADYEERSLTSSLTGLGDQERAARSVYDAVAGFGALQRYLDDPEIEEIWINEPGRVFVAKRGRSELTTTILDEGEVRDLVEKMLRTTGRRVDLSTPFVVPTVAASVDIVVHIAKDGRGHRSVREVVAVPGRVEGDVVE